ncbi:MAG TPA: class I SAM-dependent methyltransferase [Spirochaetia bacterium]|nr:class I SAM-dependent methyltransferase [Spirochaetia bacterium]
MKNNRKELSRVTFSREAVEYDDSPRYSPLRASYPAIVAEILRYPFRSILDVGCGTGTLLSMIHEQQREARLCGVDLSEQMIEMAKAKLPAGADLRVSDSEKLPFRAGSFDVLMCTFSFHHHPDPTTVLSEMRRVLTPSGRLVMADPLIPAPLRQVMNLLVPLSKDGTVRFYSRREMYALAQSVGLRVSRWLKLNWHSYLLVAESQ